MQILPQDTSWFSIANGTVAAVSSIVTIIFSLIPVFEMNRIGKRLERIEAIIEREDNSNRLNILLNERLSIESKIVAHQVHPVWKSGIVLLFCSFPLFYLMHSVKDMNGWALRGFALVVTWIGCLLFIDTWVSSLFQNRIINIFYYVGKALPRSKASRFDRNLPSPLQLLGMEAAASLNLSLYFYNYLLLQWQGSDPLEAFGQAVFFLALNSGAGMNTFRALVRETEKRAALLLSVE